MLNPPRMEGFSRTLRLDPACTFRSIGLISKVVGLTIEAKGPSCSIGDLVRIETGGRNGGECLAEVVGFRDDRVLLFPLEEMSGVRSGDKVLRVSGGLRIPVGPGLLGRVLDGLGRPIDGKGPVVATEYWPVHRPAPNSMLRTRIAEPLPTGVRCIDAMTTCGKGQRMGIFAGSGVGKSSLIGMICRNCRADLNVVSLIGERGKEVRDFIEDALGEEGLQRSVLVVSTSDKSPMQRVKGAETGMAIAEYFRDRGRDVMFVMDSVTRYAMAQREIGLAVGEPPATRGYPPSVFSMMPALLERAGTDRNGSITGFFSVLVEGDDMNDPIADTARGILDGHVELSRALAAQGHYPAVDVLTSISRVMSGVVSPEHRACANTIRGLLATYRNAEDMINIGAYSKGGNPKIDAAIAKKPAIDSLLRQELDSNTPFDDTMAMLRQVAEG
ncbi:MAG: FliI/YscN family ATPase [Victivallales bacterium]|nr:FliI/YscN family ATPase [Victivallales bacterium]